MKGKDLYRYILIITRSSHDTLALLPIFLIQIPTTVILTTYLHACLLTLRVCTWRPRRGSLLDGTQAMPALT